MKVLLNTNVVLGYLGANQGFAGDAEKVFEEDKIPSYTPVEFVEKFS